MQRDWLPLPAGLQALWLLHQQNPGSYQYPLAFRISGKLNTTLLRKSILELIQAHPALRLGVEAKAGGIYACIEGNPENRDVFPVEGGSYETLDSPFSSCCRDFLDRASSSELYTLQYSLIKAGENSFYLLLCVHHISVDAWSMALLMKELAERYRAAVSNLEFRMPLRDRFPAWLDCRYHHRPQEKKLAENFWLPALSAIPTFHGLESPTFTVNEKTVSPDSFELRVDDDVFQHLKRLCCTCRCTMFMLMQTLFSLAVAIYSDRHRVVTATPCARRHTVAAGTLNLDSTVGCLAGLVCIPFSYTQSENYGAIITRMRCTILECLNHSAVDFPDIVSMLAPDRIAGRNPLVQLVFTQRTISEIPLALSGCEVRQTFPFTEKPGFELEVELLTTHSGMTLNWLCDGRHITLATVQGLAAVLTAILNQNRHRSFTQLKPADLVW